MGCHFGGFQSRQRSAAKLPRASSPVLTVLARTGAIGTESLTLAGLTRWQETSYVYS